MAGPALKRMTAEEYLALEREALEKHEFYNGQMYAMAGCSRQHDRIVFNLTVALGASLCGRPCEGFTSDMRVMVKENGLLTYPDASISCGEPTFLDSAVDTLVTPKVIFEVVSPSTERYDRGEKFRLYQDCESITDIVFVSQDKVFVEHFQRLDQTQWRYTAISTMEARLELETVGVSLSLAELYEKVEFPEPVPPESDSKEYKQTGRIREE